jgi:hypothetical protein
MITPGRKSQQISPQAGQGMNQADVQNVQARQRNVKFNHR